jgi:hypothetical protein
LRGSAYFSLSDILQKKNLQKLSCTTTTFNAKEQ